MKIISFNMQFGRIWDDRAPDDAPVNVAAAIEAIQHENADVILLQEVEQVDVANGPQDPAPNYTVIKKALAGYHSYFSYPAYSRFELPFGYGLAIFSRHPLTEKMRVDLPEAPVSFPFQGKRHNLSKRLLIGVHTTFNGQEIRVLNTHLQAYFMIDRSSDDYPQQRQCIEQTLRQSSLPTILGGDFNVAPGETTIGFFESIGYQTAQRRRSTWKRRPYTLDHIFYNRAFSLQKCRIFPTPASDHNIVSAVLQLA